MEIIAVRWSPHPFETSTRPVVMYPRIAFTNSDLLMSTSGPSSAISNSGRRDAALYSFAKILAILFMLFLMFRSWTDAGSQLPSQMDVLSDAPDRMDKFPSSDVSMLWESWPSYEAMSLSLYVSRKNTGQEKMSVIRSEKCKEEENTEMNREGMSVT